MNSYKNKEVIDYKNLRARKKKKKKNVELTLIFPNEMSIYECHKICDLIEVDMASKFGDISASIHLEPECIDAVSN